MFISLPKWKSYILSGCQTSWIFQSQFKSEQKNITKYGAQSNQFKLLCWFVGMGQHQNFRCSFQFFYHPSWTTSPVQCNMVWEVQRWLDVQNVNQSTSFSSLLHSNSQLLFNTHCFFSQLLFFTPSFGSVWCWHVCGSMGFCLHVDTNNNKTADQIPLHFQMEMYCLSGRWLLCSVYHHFEHSAFNNFGCCCILSWIPQRRAG